MQVPSFLFDEEMGLQQGISQYLSRVPTCRWSKTLTRGKLETLVAQALDEGLQPCAALPQSGLHLEDDNRHQKGDTNIRKATNKVGHYCIAPDPLRDNSGSKNFMDDLISKLSTSNVTQ